MRMEDDRFVDDTGIEKGAPRRRTTFYQNACHTLGRKNVEDRQDIHPLIGGLSQAGQNERASRGNRRFIAFLLAQAGRDPDPRVVAIMGHHFGRRRSA